MTASLPLCYFKPTICWVDDNQIFLDAMNTFFTQHYNCLTFNDPNEAIQFFSTYQAPLSKINFKREFRESDIFGTNEHYPVDINIPILKDLLFIPDKFREIAVLIIDYNMPGTNGLELCQKLCDSPIKKILLTGEASFEIATEAFNHGLIDRFIRKDHNTSNYLPRYIDELINQYFYEVTADIISHIEASRPSLLSDNYFVDYFYNWRRVHNIVEFYLINRHGSYIVKDSAGKVFYFIVMSEKDKNEFVELNDELFDQAGPLLKRVSQGELIPFFGLGKESWDIAPKEWESHFYHSETILGRENYYVAVVSA